MGNNLREQKYNTSTYQKGTVSVIGKVMSNHHRNNVWKLLALVVLPGYWHLWHWATETAAQHRKGHQDYQSDICAKHPWKQFTNSWKLARDYCEQFMRSTWCPKRGDL